LDRVLKEAVKNHEQKKNKSRTLSSLSYVKSRRVLDGMNPPDVKRELCVMTKMTKMYVEEKGLRAR
jgi:hypothetical protein